MRILFKQRTIEEQQMLIARRARMARLWKGWTQKVLSENSQVSYATVRKFEQTGEITFRSLLCIANALDEDETFAKLFQNAEFYEHVNHRIFKRPKLCKDGSYIPKRQTSEKFMWDEDLG